MKKTDIIVFDLDGTLANINHRRHLVENGKKDWDRFYKLCVNDTPNKWVVDIYKILYPRYEIYIASGRSEVVKPQTLDWLESHQIDVDLLFMRKEGDYRPDEILKKEWLDEWKDFGLDIVMAFDDRDKIVKMWRKNGIPCFQVDEGAF